MSQVKTTYAPPQQHPPLGIDPQNIYKPPLMGYQDPMSDHTVYEEPKKGLGAVYGAVYSGVPVYEMMCRNVAVMRRQKDSFLNATQVLKVAQIDKGKRTKILEKEIQNRDHEKVQGGYGKYQGTWIPFERALDLARQYGVEELLRPLLEYTPPEGQSDKTPTKEQVMGTNPLKTNTASRKLALGYQPEKRMKMDPEEKKVDHYHQPEALSEQFFDFHDAKNYYNPYISGGYYGMDPYMHYHPPPMPPPVQNPIATAAEPSSERHRASIMALFLNNSSNPGQESMFLHSALPPDFDIDLILDDQGHTALHWAAALANINLLTLLIQKGAQIDRLNYSGESALMRSIMVSHNYDRQSFLELLTILKDTIMIKDKKNRTILHQISLASSAKGKSQTSIYYMQCLLEFVAKSAYDEAMSSQLVHSDSQVSIARRFSSFINIVDICGDTAINIAARLGNRVLFNMLVESGSDVSIPNYAGLRPFDFGFDITNRTANKKFQKNGLDSRNSACVVYPSIQSDQESSNYNSPMNPINNEKSKDDLIEELKNQLNAMSREITSYRKEIDPLRKENETIPELKSRIHALERQLSRKELAQSVATVPNGMESDQAQANEEISRLRMALAHQKTVEAHLCQELVNLRGTIGSHELSCKKIIAACCNVPLQHIDELLQPLLEALESDDFNLDMRLISGFLSRIRAEGANTTSSDVPSEGSAGFLM